MESLIFSAIWINEEIFKEYNYSSNSFYLDKLSQINIFVGMNNSGKSRFIRKLFANQDLKFLSPVLDILSLNKICKEYLKSIRKFRNSGGNSLPELDGFFNELEKLEFIFLKKINDFQVILQVFEKIIRWFNKFDDKLNLIEFQAKTLTGNTYRELYKLIPKDNNVTFYKYEDIYIPTLRGLRPIQSASSENNLFENRTDSYLHRTVFDYFKGENFKENIYTGLSLYEDLQKYSHGNPSQREQLKNFQKFLSESFFQNDEVELIPTYQKDVVNVKIGKYEYPIFNLGDGIQALIILTYPLFFNQGRVMKIYMEEPEIHLHPGFQRKFIETLLKPEFESFQYFITTHSNHFLDITLDKSNISIYSFEKTTSKSTDSEFLINDVSDSNTNILSLIGVRNSSVFLSNCTIWVEGITDRIYIRKYLDIIQADKKIKFMEDTHYSFVEYGGNNITHWSFLDAADPKHPNILVERLCGKLFLIADNDNFVQGKKSNKKGKRFVELKKKLKNRFYKLKCREIENLLKPNVIIDTLNTFKNECIIEKDSFTYEDYKSEYLGNFIDKKFYRELKKKYSDKSGTILDKVEFAKKAVEFINDKNDLSSEALGLSKKIYNFIHLNNSHVY